MNFEINLILLIKPFFYMTKNSRQNFKYLEYKKSFQSEMKSIFHHFQRDFSYQKLSQTWECAFKIVTLDINSKFTGVILNSFIFVMDIFCTNQEKEIGIIDIRREVSFFFLHFGFVNEIWWVSSWYNELKPDLVLF